MATVREAAGMRVRVEGSGPPVVFVHGALVDGRLWDGVVARLRDRFTCVVPEMAFGAHRQPLPPGADRSPAGHAARIAALIEDLGRGPVTLVGNDSGGAVCQLVAADHGEHVARLVLTNCDALEVFPPAAYAYLGWVARSRRTMALLARVLNALPVLARLPTAYGWLADRIDGDLLRSWLAPLLDPAVRDDVAGFLREVRPAVTLAAADRLAAGFRRPVLLAWGVRDPFFRIELAERLAGMLFDARIERLDARCYVPLDAPAALAERITAFAEVERVRSTA